MKSKQFSVDRDDVPYKQFRDAMYDRRIAFYPQPILLQEIVELEYDEPKHKIDHPVHGSKDAADAVCGAYSATSPDLSSRPPGERRNLSRQPGCTA